MKITLKKYYLQLIALAFIAVVLMRCTPIDYHYSDYLENAERIYPGRVDSISFKPGNNRGAIRALISTDSRVVKVQVSWIGGSFETPITPEDIGKYKEFTIPEIDEGIYTFEIRTYDNEGHQSMRSEIFGRVYGSTYTNNLNNRIIYDAVRNEDDELLLNWIPEAADSTLLGVELRYLKEDGDSVLIYIPGGEESSLLPQVNAEATAHFRTLYKPSSIAIDTFYAAWVDFLPMDYIEPDRDLYDRTSWSIAGFSSENNNDRHAVRHLLDDLSETFWIARFSAPGTNYPDHWVTIDMNEILEVDGFMFAQKNGDRKIRELEVQISDDNSTWESLGLFGLENVDRVYQYLDLPERKSFRYFKIIPRAGHDNQQAPGLAEAGTFKFSY